MKPIVWFKRPATTAVVKAPPATPAEREWWREASKPHRRRMYKVMIPVFAGMPIFESLLRSPAAFFAGKWMTVVPLGVGSAVVCGLLSWYMMSGPLLRAQLPGKRIRDALVAEASERV